MPCHLNVFLLECSSYEIIQSLDLRLSSGFPLMANVFAEREACTLGLVKWSTRPSSLIIFTSSMPWILFTPSFFRQFYIICRVKTDLRVTEIIKGFVVIPELSCHQSLSCERSSFFFSKFPFPQSEHSEASRAFPCWQAWRNGYLQIRKRNHTSKT